ncbi:MAG: hypothetical protein FJY67_01135 [Calditrichaeota bacterium]|nr:hypothetical protein [Calditrichota bacterium]
MPYNAPVVALLRHRRFRFYILPIRFRRSILQNDSVHMKKGFPVGRSGNLTTMAAALLILLAGMAGCGGKKQSSDEAALELFAQAQELQKEEKFSDAVRIYRQIVRDHSSTRQGINSQFMIGYIYANHIRDLEQARIELSRFIEKYGSTADSGLVAGARFELEYLGKNIDEIPILSTMGTAESGVDTADGR